MTATGTDDNNYTRLASLWYATMEAIRSWIRRVICTVSFGLIVLFREARRGEVCGGTHVVLCLFPRCHMHSRWLIRGAGERFFDSFCCWCVSEIAKCWCSFCLNLGAEMDRSTCRRKCRLWDKRGGRSRKGSLAVVAHVVVEVRSQMLLSHAVAAFTARLTTSTDCRASKVGLACARNKAQAAITTASPTQG